MSTPSGKTRYLLDKNVIRRAIAALRYGRLRPLTAEEMMVLSFWRAVEQQEGALLISPASSHLLRRLTSYAEVQTVLDSVAVLWPTRYYGRWARRIRETTGLTREDCSQIALASFGTDAVGVILGVHCLVTFDQALITGYHSHLAALNRRLHAMTAQLQSPFNRGVLPIVAAPEELLIG